MPVHDWTRVDAGIFHAFHVGWTSAISESLNAKVLPPCYYALPERRAACSRLDCGTFPDDAAASSGGGSAGATTSAQAAATLAHTAEAETSYYHRKQTTIVVREATDDRVVAVVDIVSPANKRSPEAMRSFVERAADALRDGVHLLIIDLLPHGPHDPQGVHAALWELLSRQAQTSPPEKQLTLAAYEATPAARPYVRAVGDVLGEMPLFLKPKASAAVPLETAYQAAFAALPYRWRRVLDEPSKQ